VCQKNASSLERYSSKLYRSILMKFGRTRLKSRVCMFQFLCRSAFFITFCLANRTPKITRILTLYQANAPTLTSTVFFIKHTPKLIIFGTNNLQTFRLNILINTVLLMQFYLVNIRPKLHHRKLRKLCITLLRTFSTSPAAC